MTTQSERQSGPFIVTTKRPTCSQGVRCGHAEVSRRAVATLDEAMDLLHEAVGGQRTFRRLHKAFRSGGTVGPLPDGTVIEVELVEWPDLFVGGGPALFEDAAILAAYNAKQKATGDRAA